MSIRCESNFYVNIYMSSRSNNDYSLLVLPTLHKLLFTNETEKKNKEIQQLSNVSVDIFFAVENSIANHNCRSEC